MPEREAVAFGPYEPLVRSWLTADLDAPRKQRHTARRVWQRLLEEREAQVAESTIRPHVARLKVEVGLARKEVMVPQTHPPAEEVEVDFGQFEASIAGVVLRLWMFVMRLSHSGRAVHLAYANQAQESFLDGHVKAFEALGGVPTGMIRYDNLKPPPSARVAVSRPGEAHRCSWRGCRHAHRDGRRTRPPHASGQIWVAIVTARVIACLLLPSSCMSRAANASSWSNRSWGAPRSMPEVNAPDNCPDDPRTES